MEKDKLPKPQPYDFLMSADWEQPANATEVPPEAQSVLEALLSPNAYVMDADKHMLKMVASHMNMRLFKHVRIVPLWFAPGHGEALVRKAWSEVLGCPEESLSVTASFFEVPQNSIWKSLLCKNP